MQNYSHIRKIVGFFFLLFELSTIWFLLGGTSNPSVSPNYYYTFNYLVFGMWFICTSLSKIAMVFDYRTLPLSKYAVILFVPAWLLATMIPHGDTTSVVYQTRVTVVLVMSLIVIDFVDTLLLEKTRINSENLHN